MKNGLVGQRIQLVPTRGPNRVETGAALRPNAVQTIARVASGGGGGVTVERGATGRPAASVAVSGVEAPRLVQAVMSGGSAAAGTVGASERPPESFFPLAGFLITEGSEDTLHESYQTCFVELDRSGFRTLLYLDIGNPNVKGPTVQQLVADGTLRFDPNELAE